MNEYVIGGLVVIAGAVMLAVFAIFGGPTCQPEMTIEGLGCLTNIETLPGTIDMLKEGIDNGRN